MCGDHAAYLCRQPPARNMLPAADCWLRRMTEAQQVLGKSAAKWSASCPEAHSMWKAQALASSLAHLRWRRAAVATPRSACPSSPKGSKRPQSHRRRTRRLLSELDDRFVTLRTVAMAMRRSQRTAALSRTSTPHTRAAKPRRHRGAQCHFAFIILCLHPKKHHVLQTRKCLLIRGLLF